MVHHAVFFFSFFFFFFFFFFSLIILCLSVFCSFFCVDERDRSAVSSDMTSDRPVIMSLAPFEAPASATSDVFDGDVDDSYDAHQLLRDFKLWFGRNDGEIEQQNAGRLKYVPADLPILEDRVVYDVEQPRRLTRHAKVNPRPCSSTAFVDVVCCLEDGIHVLDAANMERSDNDDVCPSLFMEYSVILAPAASSQDLVHHWQYGPEVLVADLIHPLPRGE